MLDWTKYIVGLSAVMLMICAIWLGTPAVLGLAVPVAAIGYIMGYADGSNTVFRYVPIETIQARRLVDLSRASELLARYIVCMSFGVVLGSVLGSIFRHH